MSDDPRAWLGRGLEPVPGKPFGWAHSMERRAIIEHLERRPDRWSGPLGRARMNFRASAIQVRLHRSAPSFAERHAKWKARQPVPVAGFNVEELEHLAEHFAGANDPVGQSIRAKAAAMVETHKR